MPGKLKIGLALGSGGPRGLAHIGVIKALVEAGVEIDVITGTSAGSVIGGFYALTKDIGKVEEIFVNLQLKDLVSVFSDVAIGSGIIRGKNMEKFLDGYFKGTNIENLGIKFAAVATDIRTTKDVVFTKGNMTKAIRASSSVPGFFDVFQADGNYLVDGGVGQPVPIRAARELGAEWVIAVNLDDYIYKTVDINSKTKATKVAQAALKLMRYRLSQELCTEADWVIEPEVSGIISWASLPRKEQKLKAIEKGYQAMKEIIPEIKLTIGKVSPKASRL